MALPTSPDALSRFREDIVVLLLGLGVLSAAGIHSPRVLCWSDEIVYAVMGRNIATGAGVITNFYHASSLLERGFPLGDVHVPGHAFLLALSFLLFGQTQWAAVLPGQICFVLSGLLVSRLGRREFGSSTGLTAAALFYLMPPLSAYALSAMSELTLVLLSAIYLVVWFRALQEPGGTRPILLALVLGLGATVRETFLVLVPSAVYALWRAPRSARIRALASFALGLGAYLLLVFLPLYLARAPHPHFLSSIAGLDGPERLREILGRAASNVKVLASPGPNAPQLVFTSLYVTSLILPLAVLRCSGALRRLAVYTAVSYLSTLAVLVAVYPLRNWGGVRVFMFTAPSSALLLAAVLMRLRPLAARYSATVLAAAILASLSWHADDALAADRRANCRVDEPYARAISRHAAPLRPRAVIAESAFLYGWTDYPVTVVWHSNTSPGTIRALAKILPIDVIVVREQGKVDLIEGIERGPLAGMYRLANEIPDEGLYFFVNDRRGPRD